VIFKHKLEQSIGIDKIPTWLAKSFALGDFFEKSVMHSVTEFNRKLRRSQKAKIKKLTVVGLENIGEKSYFYLTDGAFTYKFKLLESKKYAFLVDFDTREVGEWISWS
jgi:hypothetical protein